MLYFAPESALSIVIVPVPAANAIVPIERTRVSANKTANNFFIKIYFLSFLEFAIFLIFCILRLLVSGDYVDLLSRFRRIVLYNIGNAIKATPIIVKGKVPVPPVSGSTKP